MRYYTFPYAQEASMHANGPPSIVLQTNALRGLISVRLER